MIEYKVLSSPINGKKYKIVGDHVYYSERYDNFITVPDGFLSDGATGAFDIHSDAWKYHDVICERTTWDDGTPIKAWQASMVLADILRSEGRWFRALYWQASTFLLGCVKTRSNGWF